MTTMRSFALAWVITVAMGAGTPEVVDDLRASSAQPLAVTVLVDVSASVGLSDQLDRDRQRAVEADLFPYLRPDDRVWVTSFAATVPSGADFIGAGPALKIQLSQAFAVARADRMGSSRVWDAIDEALTALSRRTEQRAVVLLTDGKATGNYTTRSAVRQRAIDSGVAICVMAFAAVGAPYELLAELASSTGCVSLRAPSPLDIGPALSGIGRALATQRETLKRASRTPTPYQSNR